jgi:nucleoside-diphosphate-sugar epimerase
MRVFVAGATGVIGRPLVCALIAAGHEVTAMTRSPDKTAALAAAGATPVVCDAFDAAALEAAVRAAGPDVIINELTDLPSSFAPRAMARAYETTNRLRTEAMRTLIDAGAASGAKRVIAQSIAFLYAPEGPVVQDEDGRPFSEAPPPFGDAVRALVQMEALVTSIPGIDGLVLRYGAFYGPGTWYAAGGSTAEAVRRRRYPIVGDGGGVFSFVHVDDAATATVAAVAGGAPGVYNIVDDEPAPMREWIPVYARALGAPQPRRVPAWLARLAAGRATATMATSLRGASNAKAKRELGWQPRHASWRTGFAEDLGGATAA